VAAPAERSLVIGSSARSLRRRVGLTAWVALEELLLDALPHAPGILAVHASARSLAARLDMSKDTAAAALRRLTAAGVVRCESHRDAVRGVFARSVYLLDVDRFEADGIELRGAPASARPRRSNVEASGAQGALFEPEPAVPA
jgi:hypothetical protein